MRDREIAALADPRAASRRTVLAAGAALLAAGRTVLAGASVAPLRIAGTGGAAATMRALAGAYNGRDPAAEELCFLPNLGTSGGIGAVLAGAADIALAARTLTDAERAAGARQILYARTPLAFATRADGGPARALALADAVRIYDGEQVAWPDGTPIRIVRRPATESDTSTLAAASPALARALARALAAAQHRPGLVTAGSDQDNADALEAVHGSFGAITLAHFLSEQRRLALLALDGVEPSPEAVAAGRYPFSKVFSFVTGSRPGPAAAAFMAFATGPEGAAILAGLGQEPVGAAGAVGA